MAPNPAAVSVILPVYRLAATVGDNVRRVDEALAGIEDLEIIFVDDGSDDGTRQAAEAAAAGRPRVRVIGYPDNAGKGHALREGFHASSGSTVVLLDGDLDLPPEQVPGLLARHAETGVDALVGTKRQAMRAGDYPFLRRVLSRMFSTAVQLLFRLPVSETQTGLKVFRRAPLERHLDGLRVARYAFDLELLAKMQRDGCRLAEAPVVVRPAASASSVSAGTLWEMARDTAGVWWRLRIRHRGH